MYTDAQIQLKYQMQELEREELKAGTVLANCSVPSTHITKATTTKSLVPTKSWFMEQNQL